jgi:hypothetical protein
LNDSNQLVDRNIGFLRSLLSAKVIGRDIRFAGRPDLALLLAKYSPQTIESSEEAFETYPTKKCMVKAIVVSYDKKERSRRKQQDDRQCAFSSMTSSSFYHTAEQVANVAAASGQGSSRRETNASSVDYDSSPAAPSHQDPRLSVLVNATAESIGTPTTNSTPRSAAGTTHNNINVRTPRSAAGTTNNNINARTQGPPAIRGPPEERNQTAGNSLAHAASARSAVGTTNNNINVRTQGPPAMRVPPKEQNQMEADQ